MKRAVNVISITKAFSTPMLPGVNKKSKIEKDLKDLNVNE